MTADVKAMTIREYLAQGDYWIDDRTGGVFRIADMSRDRRERAARQMIRMATAVISLAEADAARQGELPVALQLVRQSPRDWVVHTELYRALYPEPAGEAPTEIGRSGNREASPGVVRMSAFPRTG